MSGKCDLLRDTNAISELVGYLILLSVAITAIGIIYVMAMPQIQDSQEQATFQNVEQAFTVLDTHMSKSQYSNELSQVTEMKLNGGRLAIDETDSYIEIWFKGKNGNPDELIYQRELGTIYYTLDGREVGYEGGGIWEKYPDGGSAMLSAPDFNYNGETLTLPLMQIKVSGTEGVSSSGTVYITSQSNDKPEYIYPNQKPSPTQENPVNAEEIYVIIKSRYYQAWANYINSNTDGTAQPDKNNQKVKVTFYTVQKGTVEPFDEHTPIEVKRIDYTKDYPLTAFWIDLKDVKANARVYLRCPDSNSDPGKTTPAAMYIMFQKGTGNNYFINIRYSDASGKYEEFTAKKLAVWDPVTQTAYVDWLDKNIDTTYASPKSSWTWEPDAIYNNNDPGPKLYYVLQHYFKLMSKQCEDNGESFSFIGSTIKDGGAWPGAGSTYLIDYDATNVLTYMHITNNPIIVTFG